jgi:hypothetical protein
MAHLGYIKLHRKILTNDVFINDPTAWHIFEYLMLMCDWQTGKRDIGRFQLARELKIKPATIYAGLKRLEKKHKMIAQVSNNRFTSISILNWATYQQGDNITDNNRITTESQQSSTNKEYKNIRNKEKAGDRFKIKPPADHIPYRPKTGVEADPHFEASSGLSPIKEIINN